MVCKAVKSLEKAIWAQVGKVEDSKQTPSHLPETLNRDYKCFEQPVFTKIFSYKVAAQTLY